MTVITTRLYDKEIEILETFMRENDIKSKSSAVRECINLLCAKKEQNDLIFDITTKLNRIIHNENILKKLIEQLFANNGFAENYNIKDDECLKDFYKNSNNYNNNFLG